MRSLQWWFTVLLLLLLLVLVVVLLFFLKKLVGNIGELYFFYVIRCLPLDFMGILLKY